MLLCIGILVSISLLDSGSITIHLCMVGWSLSQRAMGHGTKMTLKPAKVNATREATTGECNNNSMKYDYVHSVFKKRPVLDRLEGSMLVMGFKTKP